MYEPQKQNLNFSQFYFSFIFRKTSFDNAAYIKEDLSKDDSLDETSFMSRDDTLSETVSECPRWADSYDRARKIAGRNRSNVPVGRFFDIHNPGGGTSKI